MKIAKAMLLLLAAWLGLAAAFTGCTCVVNHYHYGTPRPSAMYVAGAPPAPREETRTAAPEEGWVWIQGHWEWSASQEEWIWVGGLWVEPPDDGATWVDPEYEENNGDWMYSPGYWRWEDPGAPQADEPGVKLPPGDLHWSGGGEVAKPGEDAQPAEPKSPPGSITIGTTKSDLPVPGPKLVQPEGKGEPPVVAGPTLPPKGEEPKAEGPAKVEEPPAVADDPYGDGKDGGDKGSKKIKKPGTKDVEQDKPDFPPKEEHGAAVKGEDKPAAAPPADPYAEEEDQPAKKHGKKHKAKSGEDEGSKTKIDDPKEPKKIPKPKIPQ